MKSTSITKRYKTILGDLKKGLLLTSVVVMILLIVPMVLSTQSVFGQEKNDFQASWYRWDDKYWPTEPVHGGYLQRAAPKYVGIMNPNHWPVNDFDLLDFFHDFPLNYNGKLRPIVPHLMRTWEYVDLVTMITTFQKGVEYHDGSPLNAESVKYNIEWCMDKKNGAWTRSYYRKIKSLEVIDEHTLKWHFNEPWAGYLGTLAYISYMISEEALKGDAALKEYEKIARKLKKAKRAAEKADKKAKKATSKGEKKAQKAATKAEKAWKKVEELKGKTEKLAVLAKGAKNLDTYPVGTGPYMLEEAKPGNYVKLKRNPKWWFGKMIGRPEMPYFDGIKSIVIPDPAIQLANLRAGKIDVMSVEKTQYNLIKDDPKLNIYVIQEANTFMLWFNHAKGPCKDIRVRKAVSHAIDRKAIVDGLRFGLDRIASCVYPSNHYCHNPDLKPVIYDPGLSKKLLAEAGYIDGLLLKGHAYNYPGSKAIAEAVKAMLANVGITWDVAILDQAAISDRMKNLEYDLCEGYWSYIYDPDTVVAGVYLPDGGFNFGRSINEKVFALAKSGIEEIDFEKRKQIYWDLEKALYDNYEDAWLFYDTNIYAYRKCVQGFNYNMRVEGGFAYYYTHPRWFKDGKRN
jgi:peptide/nickel transport system substrate-binding protein